MGQLKSVLPPLLLLVTWAVTAAAQPTAWLDGDPTAIWRRSPGLYQEDGHWYAILHTRSEVARVRLAGDFTNGTEAAVDLTRTPNGKFWWLKLPAQAFARPPRAGDRYGFLLGRVDGTEIRVQDPAARRVESSNLGSWSLVTVSDDYVWHDQAWSRPGFEYYQIYQLHPLRFSDRNTALAPFERITEELDGDGSDDYLADLGVTAVQLLPVNEFAGDIGWGYNPSFFYAVESAYGTPDQLKRLVDTAYRNGVAVILDLVFNHGGSSDNILWQIAQDDIAHGTYYDGDTVWGPMVNFDNDMAWHFFVQNIVYLAREFHIDGFRFDFTRPIHNADDGNIRIRGSGGGWQFLREVREKVKAIDPSILLIAEELPNTWHVTAEDVGESWDGDRHGPFDAQWADPFHDGLKRVLTGGHLDEIRAALASFGDSWHDAVVYVESYDEVGNTDNRIARRGRDGKGWEMAHLAAAATTLTRGVPMLFMGQEGGEALQFGQDDSRTVAETAPTWWDDRLPFGVYERDPGRARVLAWHRRILEIRRGDMSRLAGGDISLVHLDDANGIAAFTRDGGKYAVVLNFRGTSWEHYDIGLRGRYQELANTSWPAFNLGGYLERS
jgi:1,4-alpha-glucan branching enzyme